MTSRLDLASEELGNSNNDRGRQPSSLQERSADERYCLGCGSWLGVALNHRDSGGPHSNDERLWALIVIRIRSHKQRDRHCKAEVHKSSGPWIVGGGAGRHGHEPARRFLTRIETYRRDTTHRKCKSLRVRKRNKKYQEHPKKNAGRAQSRHSVSCALSFLLEGACGLRGWSYHLVTSVIRPGDGDRMQSISQKKAHSNMGGIGWATKRGRARTNKCDGGGKRGERKPGCQPLRA